MAFDTVTVIGVGTLGGFTAEAIANLDSIEKLIIIDDDVVEQKNLKNSIYRQIDLDTAKVDALKDIILQRHYDIEVWAFQTKYIEGVTKLPEKGLVIDCRDFTYNRGDEIDARFYISSRYLMGDFRKNVCYLEPQEGRYITELSRQDLKYAASMISMMIENNVMVNLIKSQSIQKYELDCVKHIDKPQCDIVYDSMHGDEKFVNLSENILPIIGENQDNEVTVFVGSKMDPIIQEHLPVKTFNDSKDIIQRLSSIVASQTDFKHFVVSVFKEGCIIYIELIPETGAA